MDYSVTIMHVFYHPETQEEEHVWIDADIVDEPEVHTYYNGNPGHPGSRSVEITSWGKCLDDTHPEWITLNMLHDALDSIDLSNHSSNDNDNEYEFNSDK
jgi:hypothetical protein